MLIYKVKRSTNPNITERADMQSFRLYDCSVNGIAGKFLNRDPPEHPVMVIKLPVATDGAS